METRYKLYGLVFVFFVFGDIVTTLVGLLFFPEITESNKVVANGFQTYGLWIMLPLKLFVVGISYGGFSLFEHRSRILIPSSLVAIGVVVTGWNILLLGRMVL